MAVVFLGFSIGLFVGLLIAALNGDLAYQRGWDAGRHAAIRAQLARAKREIR